MDCIYSLVVIHTLYVCVLKKLSTPPFSSPITLNWATLYYFNVSKLGKIIFWVPGTKNLKQNFYVCIAPHFGGINNTLSYEECSFNLSWCLRSVKISWLSLLGTVLSFCLLSPLKTFKKEGNSKK